MSECRSRSCSVLFALFFLVGGGVGGGAVQLTQTKDMTLAEAADMLGRNLTDSQREVLASAFRRQAKMAIEALQHLKPSTPYAGESLTILRELTR